MIKKSTFKLSLNNDFLLIFKREDRKIAAVKIWPGKDELNIEVFPTTRREETEDLIIRLYGFNVEFQPLEEYDPNISKIIFEL